MKIDTLLERDILPDFILRLGIRYLLKNRLKNEKNQLKISDNSLIGIIEDLSSGPIAIHTLAANEQHYEVPSSFFEIVLGPYLKYSSGFWFDDNESLETSEINMLDLTLRRAQIGNGQHILDLGCGWGSFTLYAAEQFPGAKFTAVSNSASQKQFIDNLARERNLSNISVITSDINDFDPNAKFDRIVSVEMFEHARNYAELFKRISNWLTDEGKLFAHIFSHNKYAYKFESQSDSDWMARYFFSGGMMPSRDLFSQFNSHIEIEKQWEINGVHYARTLEAWLTRMDENKQSVMRIFEDTYGSQATKFWAYWRIFFMACAETFAYNTGNEWGVSHYLFNKKK